MNKQILLTLLLVFTVMFSVTAISASDVSVTDSYATTLVDDAQDVSVPMENTADSSVSVSSDSNVDNDSSKVSLSSVEVLESENSNTLSTNTISNSLGSSVNNGVTSAASSNVLGADSGVSSTIKLSDTIVSKDITKYYKGSTKYTATFLDNTGKVISNADVKITVDGKAHTVKTDANGVASLAVNLKPGSYKVVSTNPITGYQSTNTFKILSTVTASDISKVYRDGKKFYATFLKSNGKALAKKNVKFKINGKTYTKKTNANGVASLSLKSLKKGTYKIISYNKDGLTKTNKVKVYRTVSSKLTTSSYTFLTGDTKTIKATLTNGLGYAPTSGKVIKFTINGKTYSKKTNSKGVASLKLPSLKSGSYTVKYKFAGTSYYKASSASNKVAVIPSKTPTFTVKSATTFTQGSSNKFSVALTSGDVPLEKRTVTFKVDGKTYTKTTNSKGISTLALNLNEGKHTITYTNAAESKVDSKTGSSIVTINEKTVSSHNAYWLYGADMKSVSLSDLSSKGVTDILLNYKAYDLYGKSSLESWITSANNAGIKVHIWVQVFYSNATGWVNPVKNGKENTAYFTSKINEIKTYASINGVSGIHLDYLRYSGSSSTNNAAYQTSGGTEAISSFVKQVVTAVHNINSKIIVSAALMPETTSSVKYYGQDYSVLSQYLDVAIPMVYKGNYAKDSSWITTTTKWYVDNSKGAKVWTGIQTYNSDMDVTKLSVSDLNKDIAAALNGGANGVVLFRYGISNDVNFNNLKTDSSIKTISVKDVVTGATNLKSFYENNKRLPNTVTTGGITFTLPEFLYVMSQAIYQIGNSNLNAITVISGVNDPSSPSGDTINSKSLSKDNYLTVANNVAKYISTNKQAPNYASSALGKIIYSELIDSFSRILTFYGTDKRLPDYVTITYAAVNSGSSSSSDSGSGLNEKNTIEDLSAYLISSKNCDINNAKIKSTVDSLIKGLTTDLQKATAIFNYVKNNIGYSFYYNTKYGAVGTLNAKTGNCVDHSHLLVAMFRSAGLAARYVHGTCTFSSGSTYGHVWTQVLIDGKWTVADATSSRNSLGKIANWNTKSFSLNGKYASLSF